MSNMPRWPPAVLRHFSVCVGAPQIVARIVHEFS
jgi:hypothetical protein